MREHGGPLPVDIEHRGDDLDVLEPKLRALGDDSALAGHARAAVEVKPAPIASLLVGVDVGRVVAPRRALDKVQAQVKLAQRVVRALLCTICKQNKIKRQNML